MGETTFIFNKDVDKSVLYEGFGVPASDNETVYAALGRRLQHGEKLSICVRLGDELFDATLTNESFDQTAHPKHGDILQIRYSKNSELVKKLRAVFASTFAKVEEHKKIYGNFKKSRLVIEKEELETFGLYCDGESFIFRPRVCER